MERNKNFLENIPKKELDFKPLKPKHFNPIQAQNLNFIQTFIYSVLKNKKRNEKNITFYLNSQWFTIVVPFLNLQVLNQLLVLIVKSTNSLYCFVLLPSWLSNILCFSADSGSLPSFYLHKHQVNDWKKEWKI